MGIQLAYSSKADLEELLQDLRTQLHGVSAKMVVYFASSIFPPEKLSQGMQQMFSADTAVFGCTSAGEIVSGKMLRRSVVVMTFDTDVIEDVTVEVMERLTPRTRVDDVFAQFETYYQVSMREMEYQRYVGLILFDGLCRMEERIMENIGDLTDVMFIGGAAGDDLHFETTYVYAHGRAYTNALVMALIKPAVGFDVIKTQSFCASRKILTATTVDEERRNVLEFNGQPAAEVYAQALGVPLEELTDSFLSNPVGVMVGDEPYVRSPQSILPDKSINFYCHIKEGMELCILESTDIIADTAQAVKAKQEELGHIAGLLNFNCVLRTAELQNKGLTEEYGRIFSDIPAIGFSTYGEEYIGHVNQTSTMLVFR